MAGRVTAFQRCLSILTIAGCRSLAALPLPLGRLVGRLIGRAAYWLIPRVRRITWDNVEQAYGAGLSRKEKARIVRGAVENVGIVASEFARIPRLTAGSIDRYVRVEGLEHFAPGKGAFIIGAHLGNWEWMAMVLVAHGIPTGEVVRPLDDPLLDRFVDGTRTATGLETIGKDGAGERIIKKLRAGHVVGVLIDQQPRESAVPVTFFGRPCWGTIAPVMAAVRAKVDVHPVSMTREAGGRYLFRLYPAVPFERTGDLRADLVTNSQRCQDAMEAIIRAHPEQWLWLHRRWKPRPRLEAEWARRSS